MTDCAAQSGQFAVKNVDIMIEQPLVLHRAWRNIGRPEIRSRAFLQNWDHRAGRERQLAAVRKPTQPCWDPQPSQPSISKHKTDPNLGWASEQIFSHLVLVWFSIIHSMCTFIWICDKRKSSWSVAELSLSCFVTLLPTFWRNFLN